MRPWSRSFPTIRDTPTSLAQNLAELGLASARTQQTSIGKAFQESAAIYEKLVATYPDNFDYKIGQARCLRDQGHRRCLGGHAEEAESIYRKALALFEPADAKAQTTESTRVQAGLLNNLGDLHRPGAEKAFRDSIALSSRLLERPRPANKDLP